MKRVSILAFGAVAYIVFFGTFLYLIAFVGNLQHTGLAQWLSWLPALVPHSIDFGRDTGPLALALAIDLGLSSCSGCSTASWRAWDSRPG